MKAAPEHQQRLLAVQEIDNEIARVRNMLTRLGEDAELARLDAEVTLARRAHLEQTGAWEDAQAALSRIESDVAAVEARKARDLIRLEATSSLKDIHGLEAELETLRERQDRLEDAQLETMEQVDELGRAAQEAEERLADLEARKRAAETTRSREADAHRARLQALATDRDDALSPLPQDLVELYEKQRARYGVGAALLRHGVSLGSNTTLNPADMQEIRRAAPDDVILCPESSCILVRTAESGL
jgi:predicted  nucleic acid-binding Zn-ribbon protein